MFFSWPCLSISFCGKCKGISLFCEAKFFQKNIQTLKAKVCLKFSVFAFRVFFVLVYLDFSYSFPEPYSSQVTYYFHPSKGIDDKILSFPYKEFRAPVCMKDIDKLSGVLGHFVLPPPLHCSHYTDKKKIKFSSYLRKFRMEQLQSHKLLTATSYIR